MSNPLTVLNHYARERCPPALLGTLSLVLFFAGVSHFPVAPLDAARGWLSMVLFLLLVRLSDDVADIPIDRITHPQRFLCAVNEPTLQIVRWLQLCLAGVLVLLQVPRADASAFIVVTTIIYACFFALKRRFSIITQALMLNSALAIFPVYGELLLMGQITGFSLLMGLFFWLGGIAHDFSHCLMDTTGLDANQLNPINRVNQKYLAAWSLIIFSVSGSIGLLLYRLQYTGPLFLTALLIGIIAMLFLEVPLIRKPSKKTARPFYWFGFVFFLLPALTHLIETILIHYR